jgi:hypothetical protein
MNTAYILEENKKILDAIAIYHEISSVDFIAAIRRAMKGTPECCQYKSKLNHEQFYSDISQISSCLEDYYNMAKSVNSIFISQDDNIQKQFWNIASVLEGNDSLAEYMKNSRFPELSGYMKKQRKGIWQILKRVLSGKTEVKPEWEKNISEMFEDIGLIIEREYYLYGLRLLRDILLEINCSKIPEETGEVTDLVIR